MGVKVQKEAGTGTKAYENDVIARRTAKDTVFCDLFRDKKYLLQLYQALHPEDTDTTEDDLTDVTIRNVLTDGIYNDVGFRNKDKVVILTEAQSTWSMNILIRMLMYLAETYHDYFMKKGVDLYSSKKAPMPESELYVIFVGERVHKSNDISLSGEFFQGKECAIDVKAKVLYGDDRKDIIGQYVTFSKVYTEQVKKYGYAREAVLETIRICKDKDVLTEYLKSKEREVVSIMMALFDEEYIQKAYHNRLRSELKEEVIREVEEEVTRKVKEEVTRKVEEEVTRKVKEEVTREVKEEVTREVKEEVTREAAEKEKRLVEKLYHLGVPVENIAEASEVSVDTVKQWIGLQT